MPPLKIALPINKKVLKWADVLSMKTYTKYIRKQYRCAIVKLTLWDYLVLALHYQNVPKLCDNVSTLKYKKIPLPRSGKLQ